ncbi:YfhO family protein [Nocardia colli]|uniref:YfhO family protein n=1 Tax=Nocardia colli TaxID=2545717 RepID=A0A5N0DNM3_9NOCA|nr:YfhO family protein [Nocardia colli]KAA8877291.1 YfhO family protein [Nocardia colli]
MESSALARRDVYKWGLITALGVVAGYGAVLLANVRHFYTDDTESQYAPLWVMLGNRLRDGQFPAMIPEHWMAGNYAIEEAGLLNPPQLLIDLIAPSVDNVALYATIVKLIFAIVLGLGVYRVCLEYGASAPWSAVAGVAIPFTGWLLFFDEASWYTAFVGTAWLVQAWASGVRYARGRSGPIPTFVFLYLAISVQYIFPAVEAGLMIGAVAVGEVVYQRKWVPSLRLLAASACAALAGLATYLPSALSAKVTWRGTAQINNDQFLTVPWSESLNASLPSTLPAYSSWWGYVQPMPVVYIAWFLIPALAFIDWRKARENWREFTAIALVAIMGLMWTAGPGTIGPLRWPARVLPMVALGLLVLVCVLLGRYATFDGWRRRGVAAGVLIGLLFVRSFSAAPRELGWHVLAAVSVAALGAAVVWLARTKGMAAACALTLVAVFPIAYVQVWAAQPTPMSWNLPENRSEMKAAFPDFHGTTLQLADRGPIPPAEKNLKGAYGSLVFGNYAKDLELTYVSGYTPNGHFWFGEMLCMRWDTSVCPDAFRRAFEVEPTTGRTIVDLMKVDRVVLQRSMYPDARNQPAPDGWKWVDYPGHEQQISVLERVNGLISTRNGRVAATSGVVATSVSESDMDSRVRVNSDNGGQVVFARLGWPGYRATLNGRDIPIRVVAKTFVALDIPAGTKNGDLELSWRPPGWKIGAASILLGLLGIGVLQWAFLRTRRRDDEPNSPTPADTDKPTTPSPDLVDAKS